MPDFSSIDPNKLGGGRAQSEPDYIPYNKRGRDGLPRVFFYTGVLWLGGFGAGGLYGAKEGWMGAANPSLRVRINSVMNAVSKHGGRVGNTLGVIGELRIQ